MEQLLLTYLILSATIYALRVCEYDEELFKYFLDLSIDLNNKFNVDILKCIYNDNVEYILDVVIYFGQIDLFKLCLAYGADPYINNHNPIKTAIIENELEIIKILLDMESVVDPNFKSVVDQSTIDLLEQYQIYNPIVIFTQYMTELVGH